MKHKHKNNHVGSAESQSVPVRFECTHPTAIEVLVAGSFNQWQPEAMDVKLVGGGCWTKETALAPGAYEYCLVVDGRWMPDLRAKESVPNPFGGSNSVLRVDRQPETLASSAGKI